MALILGLKLRDARQNFREAGAANISSYSRCPFPNERGFFRASLNIGKAAGTAQTTSTGLLAGLCCLATLRRPIWAAVLLNGWLAAVFSCSR